MDNYYIFTLPDCFAPAFVTFYKYYFGTAEEREKITERDMKPPIKAELLKKKTFVSAEESYYSFLNVYNCKYYLAIAGFKADVLLVKYNDTYGIYTSAEIENPEYDGGIVPGYKPLKGGFWGLSGQLQVNEKSENNFSVYTSLAYMDEQFDSEEEAIEYFNNITEPNFSGFFEDIFGDG